MVFCTLAHPGGLGSSAVERAEALLGAAGASVRAREWIEADYALRLEIPDINTDHARAALQPLRVDVDVFVGQGGATYRLFVGDMDSTMVACECLDELADYAGLKHEVAAITERAMRGELDFATSLTERVALLAGMPTSTLASCLAERVRPNPGARVLIATLRGQGVRTVLVSGGFTAFAEPVAALLGFDYVVANRLEIAGDRLTGRVLPPIVGAETKRAVLGAEAAGFGGPAAAIAIGDGANDGPMVAAAGLGIAYRGKPALEAAAGGWIRHGELTTVLWALGLPRARWVTRE